MPTTEESMGFTARAQACAAEFAKDYTVEVLCRALCGDDPFVALPETITVAELNVAIRSALAAKLMREGVMMVPSTGG
jgi:hypothetical protein